MSDDQIEIEIHETTQKLGTVQLVVRAVVAFVVLLVGVFIMRALIAAKPEAAKKPSGEIAPMVETVTVGNGPQQVDVIASGTVVPARQVMIAAEVGGRVTWINPDLEPGGRFAAGKALLKVDARDYQLAVEQQTAQVTMAKTNLEVERSRRRVAEKEWEAFGEKPPEGSVAIRDPQIKAAEGAVNAAESGLRRTKLAVSKTGLQAPFAAMVLQRQVDLGQLVGPGTPLATLVGTDQFWVQVSIPVDRLAWIAIPGINGVKEGAGAAAHVEQRLGDQIVKRTGRVVRLAGDVDPVGRMAKILVEIDDPLGLKATEPGLPLLLNSYVDVTIEGKQVDAVGEVPRVAMRGDHELWVMENGKLEVKPVEVVWRKRSTVLVRGLPAGAQVITSPVPAAVDGMAVRPAESSPGETAKGDATP
jgi:RND family efflux transporter MFP subunit